MYGASSHFCYVEACRKSHNVGVQHLLIGFHVVTIFLKATLGRMLESVCPACDLSTWKKFSLISFDLLLQWSHNSSLRNISISWVTFRTFISKFPLHVLHSRLHFLAQVLCRDWFRTNKEIQKTVLKNPFYIDIDVSEDWF